jgi:hypothetical protein
VSDEQFYTSGLLCRRSSLSGSHGLFRRDKLLRRRSRTDGCFKQVLPRKASQSSRLGEAGGELRAQGQQLQKLVYFLHKAGLNLG